jgi:uncharacterized HhH-GPD family protein
MTLFLAQNPDADALLDRDPLALLVGMLLDQQIPMEKAFAGPRVLAERMGVDRLDAAEIASYEPETFAKMFIGPPAIHRFPGAMAGRVQELARRVVDEYDGDAEAVWASASSGTQLLERLSSLPRRPRFSLHCWESSVAYDHGVGARPRHPSARTASITRWPM